MSPMFWILLGLFVVVDIVVITAVLLRFGAALRVVTLPGGTAGKEILRSAETLVGDYLRVNYSGDPGALPTALTGLLPQMRDLLRSHGVESRPEMVRALVEMAAAKHRIATPKELHDALATIG